MKNKQHIVIYGSLGMAEHVADAIATHSEYEVIAVIDEAPGSLFRGHRIQSINVLENIIFDKIIIATMDYSVAVKELTMFGYSEYITEEVFWDPFFLQIEPTTKCNFNCINCTRDKLENDRKNMDMSFDEFRDIIENFPGVKRVQLQGLGEPLLNKELFKMATFCKEKNISVSLTTNASLLDEKSIGLLNSSLDKIIISIDGVDEDSFGRMRKKGIWTKIENNIDLLIESKGSAKVVFNFVVSKDNIKDCEKIINFTLKKMPEELHIQAVENWTILGQAGFESETKFVKDSEKSVELVGNSINHWGNLLSEKSITLSFTDLSKRMGYCWWPFFGMFISVDGFSTPCCIRMQPEISTFGKINKKLWLGDDYKKFRKSHRGKSKVVDVCKNCPF